MNFLKKREKALALLPLLEGSLESCDLCKRACGVNRVKGVTGACRAGTEAVVYRSGAHYGEEPPLSGTLGSGTIFFSRCNMHCVYCQNHRFSQTGDGRIVSSGELGALMLGLQKEGCHNINLVSPTHYLPAIVKGLEAAYAGGLSLPIVYNTGGYDAPWVIRALEGLVDIYLPDMRYSADAMAEKYSEAPGYVENNRAVVREMYRQAGPLVSEYGIAVRGCIIRLLVLPNGISGTGDSLDFLAEETGGDVDLSVMSQYYPAYMAPGVPELSRRIFCNEYDGVIRRMTDLNLKKGWVQPFSCDFDERFAGENFVPDDFP